MREPVRREFDQVLQFKQIYLNALFFSTSDGSNCVQIDNKFYLIHNILAFETRDENMRVTERFLRASNFFVYPLRSSLLGIVKASSLSNQLEIAYISQVQKKYTLLPYKTKVS